MALKILSSPPPDSEEIAEKLRGAIAAELPGAAVRVVPASPGHFEISVVSEVFEGEPKVSQQQRVYRAISRFMSGETPLVHAIDRMETRTP